LKLHFNADSNMRLNQQLMQSLGEQYWYDITELCNELSFQMELENISGRRESHLMRHSKKAAIKLLE